MKEIEYSKTTFEVISSFLEEDTQIYFDGFGYMIKINDQYFNFYNTDELAESINGNDEAIILTSRKEKEINNSDLKLIKIGKIKKIYSVHTVLTFSESKRVSIIQRIKDFQKGLKSKISWKLFSVLFSKTHSGYNSYCINPEKYNIKNNYPCNYLKCGFLIEFDDMKCLPLFSNLNSIFMMQFTNENSSDFMIEWKDSYKFQLTTASS